MKALVEEYSPGNAPGSYLWNDFSALKFDKDRLTKEQASHSSENQIRLTLSKLLKLSIRTLKVYVAFRQL